MTTYDMSNSPVFCPMPQRDPGGSFAPDAATPSQPANPTAAIVASDASGHKPTNGQPITTRRPFAPSAELSSPSHKSDMQQDIVASDAKRQQPSDGAGQGNSGQPDNAIVVPLNSRSYVVPPIVGECKFCGKPIRRKARVGRVPEYCNDNNGRCRVYSWKAKQKGGDSIERT